MNTNPTNAARATTPPVEREGANSSANPNLPIAGVQQAAGEAPATAAADSRPSVIVSPPDRPSVIRLNINAPAPIAEPSRTPEPAPVAEPSRAPESAAELSGAPEPEPVAGPSRTPEPEPVAGPSRAPDPEASIFIPYSLEPGATLEYKWRRKPYDPEMKKKVLELHNHGYRLCDIMKWLLKNYDKNQIPANTTVIKWIKKDKAEKDGSDKK